MLHWCKNCLASKWLVYTSAFTRVLLGASIFIFSFHSVLSVEIHISTAAANSSVQRRKLTFHWAVFFLSGGFSGQERVLVSTTSTILGFNNTCCCPFVKLKEYRAMANCSAGLMMMAWNWYKYYIYNTSNITSRWKERVLLQLNT